jgi:hypothetical protein
MGGYISANGHYHLLYIIYPPIILNLTNFLLIHFAFSVVRVGLAISSITTFIRIFFFFVNTTEETELQKTNITSKKKKTKLVEKPNLDRQLASHCS